MSEKNQRDSFIFYRSFYESIKDLDKNQKAEVLEAICSYALDEYTEPLSGVSKGFFTLIKPQLDANRKRFENGSKPKQSISKTKAENKQSISKIEANKNVNDNVNNNNNDNVNNNIKKENVFVEPTTEYYSTTSTDPQIHILTENNNQKPVNYNEKTSDPNEVVVERNKKYSQNDLITDEHMVLDCFVSAGISVFKDGQFGFGRLINKIADLWTKEDILAELEKKDIGFRKEIKQCCIENNITNQQLVNYFSNKFGKKQITGFRYFFYDSNNNKINWILDELSKINQLTFNKNDNTGKSKFVSISTGREPTLCGSGDDAVNKYLGRS